MMNRKSTSWLAVLLAVLLSVPGQQLHPAANNSDNPEEEDSFLITEHSPEDVWLDLDGELPAGFAGKRILVRVAKTGTTWLLPVFPVKELALPRPGEKTPVRLTLYDALYHPQFESAIHRAMDAKYGLDAWTPGKPIGNAVHLTLWVDEAGAPTAVASATFTRYAGQKERTIELPVDAPTLKRLADADVAKLGVTFSESYRGRFKTIDLEATVNSATRTAIAFENKLGTDTKGQRATLLVAIGGGVNQKVAVQRQFAKDVTIEILQREGKEVNPTLLKNIVTQLFAGLQEEVRLSQQKEDTIVTFLFANGMKATASIGVFKGLKDQWHKERKKVSETEDSNSSKDRSKREGGFKAGSILGGVETNVAWENERDRSSTQIRKLETHAIEDMMKAIEGELPVAVLNAQQLQTLASRAQNGLKFGLGSFREGRKTLEHRQSLQALKATLSTNDSVSKLLAKTLAKKAELEAKLAAELDKLGEVHSRQRGRLDSIKAAGKHLHDAGLAVQKAVEYVGYRRGITEYLDHIFAVWYWRPPQANEGQLRRADLKNAAADAAKRKAVALKASEAFKQRVAEANKEEATIGQSLKEIARLRGELDKLAKESRSIPER